MPGLSTELAPNPLLDTGPSAVAYPARPPSKRLSNLVVSQSLEGCLYSTTYGGRKARVCLWAAKDKG